MRFSILIPVYNVEKYLEECLESVLSQDYSDFEVILVNDGSTDQSPAICRKYAEKDVRIKYYDKKNEGLLLTRRFSIRKASGEYILFLDSDDYWESGILSKIDREIKNSQADLICYRFRRVSDDGEYLGDDTGIFPDNSTFTKENKEEFIAEFVRSPRLNPLWSKCAKYSIVDKDTDYTAFGDKKGEDLLQSIALIRNADSIRYLDTVFVNYRQSPTGRARNFKIKYLDDYEVVKKHIHSNLVDMKVSDSVMRIFYTRYIEGIVSYIKAIIAISKNLEEFIDKCRHIESFSLYKEASEIVSPKDVNHSCQNLYYNFREHRYSLIYFYNRARIQIKKIIIH